MMIFTRRSFVLSALALTGCQATNVTAHRDAPILTGKYDGRYELYVGRVNRDTAFNRRSKNVGQAKGLARLALVAEGGKLRVINIDDYMNTGPNFGDFEGAFYEDGRLRITFTTSFLFNKRSSFMMHLDVPVDPSLSDGKWRQYEPNGWDNNNDAIIRLRKLR